MRIFFICVAKARVMIDVSTLSENGLSQRHAVGTFDVCLARPKTCPADIVRPHAAQLVIDRTVDNFCLFWPSGDWPLAGLAPVRSSSLESVTIIVDRPILVPFTDISLLQV